jgi:hypothetical protein
MSAGMFRMPDSQMVKWQYAGFKLDATDYYSQFQRHKLAPELKSVQSQLENSGIIIFTLWTRTKERDVTSQSPDYNSSTNLFELSV